MSRDLTRDRKVKVAVCAMIALFAGLVSCLATLSFVKDSGAAVGALFTPFGIGIGASLRFFVDANVKVHQATVAQPGGAP